MLVLASLPLSATRLLVVAQKRVSAALPESRLQTPVLLRLIARPHPWPHFLRGRIRPPVPVTLRDLVVQPIAAVLGHAVADVVSATNDSLPLLTFHLPSDFLFRRLLPRYFFLLFARDDRSERGEHSGVSIYKKVF